MLINSIEGSEKNRFLSKLEIYRIARCFKLYETVFVRLESETVNNVMIREGLLRNKRIV